MVISVIRSIPLQALFAYLIRLSLYKLKVISMSNQSFLTQSIISLSKVDFEKIKMLEDQIAADKELASEFISDPNTYMRKRMGEKSLPDDLHFHVSYKDKKHPSDTEVPENQIVLSTILRLDDSFKNEMLNNLDSLLKKQDDASFLPYCDGCKICMIAIIQ